MTSLQLQSATEKLRLHWSVCSCFPECPFDSNPQLKSCGSIEAGNNSCKSIWHYSAIRNWKVAAPLKVSVFSEVAIIHPAIRNWKVAAPLKVKGRFFRRIITTFNPQLKSCGSIEGSIVCQPPSRATYNPQLKSCGSIEGRARHTQPIIRQASIRNWKVAAPLKDLT